MRAVNITPNLGKYDSWNTYFYNKATSRNAFAVTVLITSFEIDINFRDIKTAKC